MTSKSLTNYVSSINQIIRLLVAFLLIIFHKKMSEKLLWEHFLVLLKLIWCIIYRKDLKEISFPRVLFFRREWLFYKSGENNDWNALYIYIPFQICITKDIIKFINLISLITNSWSQVPIYYLNNLNYKKKSCFGVNIT